MEGNNLSNVKILEHYGMIDPPEGPGWKTCGCCFHEDSRASARSNGSGFICNGCGVKGDAISLIKEREGIGYLAAVEKYEEITGEKHEALRGTTFKRKRPFEVDGSVSLGKRDYEGNGSLLSLGSGRKSSPRVRPRLSGRET